MNMYSALELRISLNESTEQNTQEGGWSGQRSGHHGTTLAPLKQTFFSGMQKLDAT